MKTICLYSAQLHLSGGIESVIRDLYRILPQGDIRVVAACEFGKPSWIRDEDFLLLPQEISLRAESWWGFLSTNAVDCVVFNHVSTGHRKAVLDDIASLRAKGMNCVAMRHAPFLAPLLIEGEEDDCSFDRLRFACDAVVTVSQVDAVWYAALGHRAIWVQNPIRLPVPCERTSPQFGIHSPLNVIWVGRFSPPKKPELALAVFARAIKAGANVRLTMVGGDERDIHAYRNLARKLDVSRDVELLSARPDISDLWKKANIHLLTSITESFCLVLAEAKSMGIPTVMFDIPYIDLSVSKKGLLSVRQGDVEGLAAALVELSSNSPLRERLGREARASLQGFDDAHVLSDWQKALRAIETGEGFAAASEDLRRIVPQIVFSWKCFYDRNLWLFSMRDNARRLGLPLRIGARALVWIVGLGRFVKRLFMGRGR